MSKKGTFIVFEGLDGSGKTTQLKKLEKRLVERGVLCRAEREPSGGIVGRMIRDALTGKIEFQPETLALLFAADRYEHITNEVIPALRQGVCVLCDRYVFSNVAYQGACLPLEKIAEINYLSMEELMPDLTMFIDTDPKACFDRLKRSRQELELFEDYDKAVVIRENFLATFEMFKNKTKLAVIDGNGDEETVFENIWGVVEPCFK